MLRMDKYRKEYLLIYLFLLVIIAACSNTNSQSPFTADVGSHAANWVNPAAIGRDTFHGDLIKEVQSTVPGPVLFEKRCEFCHGSTGAGKIGGGISGADATAIAAAISVIPQMKGQADLSLADIQAIAAYIASLKAGAQPVTSVIKTDNCLTCHGSDLDGGIAKISCFSCHNGADGSLGHPAAWIFDQSDPLHFHGSYGRRFNATCTVCHGGNFEGGIGRACVVCHDGTIAPILDFIPPAGQPGGQAINIITALSGAQEVPAVATAGTGTATLSVDLNTGALSGTLTFTGLTSNATAAHIHQAAAGVNGPVIIPLSGGAGGTSGIWTVPAGTVLTATQLDALKTNGLYVNVHTTNNPGGEIRGQILFRDHKA